jgi:O-antigen biosynthesis protein WbqP
LFYITGTTHYTGIDSVGSGLVIMKLFFNSITALTSLIIMCIPLSFIALLIKFTSRGPVLYWSNRVGINNIIFKMPKFRTMRINAPDVPTHLLENPDKYLTPIGSCLRKSSLDELPQLWSVLIGDMSFVGPRPALYNQTDLIELRTKKGIHNLVPGITGWAQVNGRDELPIPVKVEYDEYYMKNRSFLFDLKILWLTFYKVVKTEGVRH